MNVIYYFDSEPWKITFRLTATLRVLELSSLGKIENVLKIERLASRKPAMIAVELLLECRAPKSRQTKIFDSD
jgi:hypothetical protein